MVFFNFRPKPNRTVPMPTSSWKCSNTLCHALIRSKILSAFGLNKAHTILFLKGPDISKCILSIKVWITYKLNISPILCRCSIYLGCYFCLDPKPNKILFALCLNKACMILFLGHTFMTKFFMPIKIWPPFINLVSLSCFFNVRFL